VALFTFGAHAWEYADRSGSVASGSPHCESQESAADSVTFELGMGQGTPPSKSASSGIAAVSTLNLSVSDAPHEAVPALGSIIADKYRIEELIARGGMGAVYLATHLVSGKRLALKWMLPALGQVVGAKERFVREACATARIDHPNVVDIYDVGSDNGSVYLVMELLRGETLAQYLQRTTRLEPAEAVSLLMPALRGVAAAHAQQVIHRDLKPENIFLCRSSDGEPRDPKVLDFGISKITSETDARNLALTHSGAVMGTPYYMSPEQVRGSKDVDVRSDVYAFGVILYELLTGQRPFDAETYNQLILKIATESPAPIPELNAQVDRKLVAVIERAMARDPAARFSGIEALAVALEPFAAGATFRASTVRPPGSAAPSGEYVAVPIARRKTVGKRLVAVGAVLGCLLAGLCLWLFSPSHQPAAQTEEEASALRPQEPEPERAAQAEQPAAGVELAQPSPPETTLSAATLDSQDQPSAPAPSEPRARKPRSRPEHSTAPARRPKPSRADSPGASPPPDWDDRMAIPLKPANPAGPLSAQDLR